MNFELSKELREFRKTARHYVENELIPHERVVDEHEAEPPR